MKRWIACLLLSATLAACDTPTVEVGFAGPFPAGAADLPGFASHDQGYYVAEGGSTDTMVVTTRQVLLRRWPGYVVSRRQFDSLKLSRPASQRGEQYRVQKLAANSLRVSWLETDTVFRVEPGRLRRFRGWYYASYPAFAATTHWQVRRLAVAGSRLTSQVFNPDSLRLQALDTSTVRLQRAPLQVHYTLQPRTKRAIRQVHSYDGLWLPPGYYQRQRP